MNENIKPACPVDLTGHTSFSPTVKPFLRVAVLATLNLYPPQVAIWLTFGTFSGFIKIPTVLTRNHDALLSHDSRDNKVAF